MVLPSQPPPNGKTTAHLPGLPASETIASAPAFGHTFAIPTADGGQVVIREPQKVAVSGSKQRRLRELSPSEKATRRSIKNAIVFSVFAVLLGCTFWWLLQ